LSEKDTEEKAIEVSAGDGKRWIKLSGREVATLLIIAILVLSVIGFLDQRMRRDEHGLLSMDLKAVTEAQRETTYILSLRQEEREKLRLQMPESLRKRLAYDRDRAAP